VVVRGAESIGVITLIHMEIPQGKSLSNYLYLKQTKMPCFSFSLFSFSSAKSENRRAGQVLLGVEGLAPVEGGKWWGKVKRG
jgi:hypothetical protein